MINYKKRISIFIVATLFGLSGCTTSQFATAAILAVGYTIWTDKLPTDRVLEAITDKDCSTVRAEEEGGAVCVDKEDAQPKASDVPIWCYRSIAGVDCYDNEIPQYSDRLIK
ncbi:MAG: hypothetical protein K0U45_09925 [Alphaproteobacteria bacterium]|nr:hypothetical protein [Alphaproteobacteria bacterium]